MYRLLIADDEGIILKGLSQYMPWETVGCEVLHTARDGQEAIELLKKEPPDIVITDIKMPRKSGLDVARYVYENCPQVKVIILTGFAEFDFARQAIAYGVAEYALKPISKEGLLKSVRDIITRIKSEKDRMALGDSPLSDYAKKLHEIENKLDSEDLEAGRQVVIDLFSELNTMAREKRKFSPLIEKTLGYIADNYGGNLALEHIAGQVAVNKSHLSRTFKKETGVLLTDYVTRFRVEKAKELLTFTDLLTYEVAEEVGFADPAYFSRMFKKVTGAAPKDYKEGL
ncbi:MAG: response regulator [Lachnospiraceae bacterium]|jgi:two-component system response regulator YesN|nr:response regulator [Lachnospiraceae bacterium]